MRTGLPASIEKIISRLIASTNIDNSVVSDIISSVDLSLNDFEKYFTFDHPINESYGRKLIYDNGNFKILLMSWCPGDFTAIHTHGYTEWGCVYFFDKAAHRLYETVDNALKLCQKDDYKKNEIALICGDITHMMGNSGPNDLATLHIYGSNSRESDVSENATVYMPESNLVATTMGSAYLNMSKNLMLTQNIQASLQGDDLKDYFTLIKSYFKKNKKDAILKKIEALIN